MSRDIAKKIEITFADSKPMGTRGTFTYDGELWIAYPAKKNQRIFTIVDTLLGIHSAITDEMIRWINARPGDADLITRVLERTTRAKALQRELIIEKMEATTS